MGIKLTVHTEFDRSVMMSLHLSVLLSTLFGMKLLLDLTTMSSPAWFEVLQTYEYCHHHVTVASTGICWMDGAVVDCMEAGMSDDTRALLRFIKPAIEILSLLSFFVCIITHLFYKAYDKQWCSLSELKGYRPWILFGILMSIGAVVTSTAMSITLAVVTAYEKDGTCNHAVKIGWAVILMALLTGVLVVLANGFGKESAEMVEELSEDSIEEAVDDSRDEEKVALLVPLPDDKI